MRKLALLALSIISFPSLFAQRSPMDGPVYYPYPPISTVKGETYWCGEPIAKMINRSELIFEGRVLSDSVHYPNPGDDDHIVDMRVLVLKQFKGSFNSDTIHLQGDVGAKIGDEALFAARSNSNVYHVLYGFGCSFIGVHCDDFKEKIYAPIQKAVGAPMMVLRKNLCGY